MRKSGSGGLRRTARRLKNRLSSGALILTYHRVADLDSDPQLLSVSPKHFAEHLDLLQKRYHPIGLRQLARLLQDGEFPRRAVVVTFDDGYADNLHNAKPLLERYDIPATVFVTTGYLGKKREFWWDELERLLLLPGTLPETLGLNINGKNCQWELGDGAKYSENDYKLHRGWSVLDEDNPTSRHCVYRALCQLLRPLGGEEREGALGELQAWAGDGTQGRASHRVLTGDEIVSLADGGVFEIGAHTMTHPVLSALPAAVQKIETSGSKTCLEEILGKSVKSFAYTYGAKSDYTAETVHIVREAGFDCACSNFEGVVRSDTDTFQLPRVLVRDYDGETFSRRLRDWFDG